MGMLDYLLLFQIFETSWASDDVKIIYIAWEKMLLSLEMLA